MDSQKTNFTIIGAILAATIIPLIALVFMSGSSEATQEEIESARAGALNVKWAEESDVVMTEYANYECGHCKNFTSVIDELEGEYSDQVRFEFRVVDLPFTLDRKAAEAAEAAGLQGKYWEMHDIIFDRQSDWSGTKISEAKEKFIDYAGEIGINDLDKFEEDMNGDLVDSRIDQDLLAADTLGVNSTPTVYINGERVESSYLAIKAALDEALGTNEQAKEEESDEEMTDGEDTEDHSDGTM